MSKFIYPQQTEEFLMNNDSSEAWLQPSLSDPSFLRYRKNNAGSYLSNPVPMLHNKEFVKKCQVSQIIQSVRRSVRGGSQIFNKRTGTYRINENMKENGHIGLPPSATTAKVGFLLLIFDLHLPVNIIAGKPGEQPDQPAAEPRHQADPGQAAAGGDEAEQEGGGSEGEPSLLRLSAVLRSPGEQVQE